MKQWVFSQVSRFSSEPPILSFESLIQSGGSSSLILESPPSGMNSSRSENPQIDVLHFPPFVLGFIPIFVLDESHRQIWDNPSSFGNQSSVNYSFEIGLRFFVLLFVSWVGFWCYIAFNVCALSHSLKHPGAWIYLRCFRPTCLVFSSTHGDYVDDF